MHQDRKKRGHRRKLAAVSLAYKCVLTHHDGMKKRRSHRQVAVEAIATHAGVARSTIENWLAGRRTPNAARYEASAVELGYRVEDLRGSTRLSGDHADAAKQIAAHVGHHPANVGRWLRGELVGLDSGLAYDSAALELNLRVSYGCAAPPPPPWCGPWVRRLLLLPRQWQAAVLGHADQPLTLLRRVRVDERAARDAEPSVMASLAEVSRIMPADVKARVGL